MGRPRSSYTLWILGHVLRALFTLLIIGICGLLLWRIAFSQRAPRELRQLSSNAVLREAYETNGGSLTILEQPDQVGHTEADDNYAYYRVDWCVFIDEADQVQLLFYYNNSTLEYVSEELGISPVLPAATEVFGVELVVCRDVTPDGYTGEEPVIEETVIRPVSCEPGENKMYTFCKYTFDGVAIEDDTAVVYLDIYYEGEEREELGTMRLYHRESRTEERALTRKEERIVKNGL